MPQVTQEQLEANIAWGLERLFGISAAEDTDYEAVAKRVDSVIDDISKGRVIRPQRKQLSDALEKAGTGDKVHDAIGRGR